MKTAFHGHDIFASELSEDKSSGMAFYCGYWEIGYLAIGKAVGISYLGS